jgi:hypothetical protein
MKQIIQNLMNSPFLGITLLKYLYASSHYDLHVKSSKCAQDICLYEPSSYTYIRMHVCVC